MNNKLVILILFILLIIPTSSAFYWRPDSSIVNGLNNTGIALTPTVFTNNSNLYLVSGSNWGDFTGYNWTGTTWQSDSSIVNGLTEEDDGAPTVFYNNSNLYLLTGNHRGCCNSWKHVGTTWQEDSTFLNGILGEFPDYNYISTSVFTNNSKLYLIIAEYKVGFHGYNWTGTTWQSDSSIVNGLNNGYNGTQFIFTNNSILYLISGGHYEDYPNSKFYGYNWTGITWQSDSSIVDGLNINDGSPTVFINNSKLYLIAFNDTNGYQGYVKNNLASIPLISSPLNNSRQYNNTVNFTWNQSTDEDEDTITYDFWLSNQSNFSSTINRTNFTNNYTGSISITNGITYYSRVRANDTYEFSDWSDVIQFTENTDPTVVNITLFPSSPYITDNLTISMNVSDVEGDALFNHYLWYKNGVLNTSWNDSTFVNYTDNFTSGDSIYVKGYVNDGYEDSSQLQSNTVIIGSSNSAPTLSGITLSSNTRKYGKNIFVNTSNNVNDTESSSVILRTYYYSGSNKIYLTNSSWFTPPNSASVSITIPWNDGLSREIYAYAEDNGNVSGQYNLTSAEVYATFTSDINPPIIYNNSLSVSSIKQGDSVVVYLNTDCDQTSGYDDCSISSVKVKVLRPDASYGVGNDEIGNWTMTHDIGTLWYFNYTSTSDIGTYNIDDYYITDDSGITKHDTSDLSFVTSTSAAPAGGGGGGSGDTTVVVTNTTWKLSTESIDIPVIITSSNTVWTYKITSNIEMSEATSSKITSTIEDRVNLILSYDVSKVDGNIFIDEILVKSINGEFKTVKVVLHVFTSPFVIGELLESKTPFKIFPQIPIGEWLASLDFMNDLFEISDNKIVGIMPMTIYGFIMMLTLIIGTVVISDKGGKYMRKVQ